MTDQQNASPDVLGPYPCILCGGIKTPGQPCRHCETRREPLVHAKAAADLCKCGHRRDSHADPHVGSRTGRVFSACAACLDQAYRAGDAQGMVAACRNFELKGAA